MDRINYEVLVVDDIQGVASDYAKLIKSDTGIPVAFAEDDTAALRICQHHDIKVLVLDQRMPVLGTDLIDKLREYVPYAKVMMLTGEASKEDVGAALNKRFNLYLSKEKILELPQKVLHLYAEYKNDFAEMLKRQHPKYKGISMKKGFPVFIYEIYKKVIDPEYIDNDNKNVLCTIFAGQEIEEECEISIAEEIVIESGIEESAGLELDGKVFGLGVLNTMIKKVLNVKNTLAVKQQRKKNQKYKIPNDNGDINKRVIEYAPVYEIYKIVIGYRYFLPFGRMKRNTMVVRKFKRIHHLTQTDYMKDNTSNVSDLGFQRIY